MNINGINNLNYIKYYKNTTSTKVNKEIKERDKDKDRIEISNESKALLENKFENIYDNKEKVNYIKEKIQNGTYTYDAKLIAKSMINSMKGKE